MALAQARNARGQRLDRLVAFPIHRGFSLAGTNRPCAIRTLVSRVRVLVLVYILGITLVGRLSHFQVRRIGSWRDHALRIPSRTSDSDNRRLGKANVGSHSQSRRNRRLLPLLLSALIRILHAEGGNARRNRGSLSTSFNGLPSRSVHS